MQMHYSIVICTFLLAKLDMTSPTLGMAMQVAAGPVKVFPANSGIFTFFVYWKRFSPYSFRDSTGRQRQYEKSRTHPTFGCRIGKEGALEWIKCTG
jgi:hypothetical protein